MMLHRPTLSLNRLVIYSKTTSVYDQSFHQGVNIIRSTCNSAGKSSIIDFIYFALGGDLNIWKDEAASCDYVMAELALNGIPVTIRRHISEHSRRSMEIYWGEYSKAERSSTEGWEVYSFQRSETKNSYSQVLFRALEIPEAKGDADANITMHQLLRLIYVDQITPVSSLMREEQFDATLTRRSIGDLLLGIYDDALYSEEYLLKDKRAKHDEANAQRHAISAAFGLTNQAVDIRLVESHIQDTADRLGNVVSALQRVNLLDNALAGTEKHEAFRRIGAKLQITKSQLASLHTKLHKQQLDFEDSIQFISSLENRQTALEESIKTRSFIGRLYLTFCPQCLAPIDVHASDASCSLCKSEKCNDADMSIALRMKQELINQIRESQSLLVKKQEAIARFSSQIPAMEQQIQSLEGDLSVIVQQVKTNRDQEMDNLLMLKGSLESKLEYLHHQAKGASILNDLENTVIALSAEIKKLNYSIASKKKALEKRRSLASSKIEEFALEILHRDLPVEGVFQSSKRVEVDFSRNSYSVDGKNNFSASSLTYLKNSVHFGIFFASLFLDFFRYPRIIMCDNIEDKGMRPERSQNFQKVIAHLSSTIDVSHQIIFTTSMVAAELNEPGYCVGREYDENHKTLNFGQY